MTGLVVCPVAPDDEAFAPFRRFVTPPDLPGERAFYSEMLRERDSQSAPVLHVNHVPETRLPIRISKIERHPHAAQCFFPLDVARYVVMVMPSDPNGDPVVEQTLAFVTPGNTGVIFHPNVWHLGATVLDRPGQFTVLMWRDGARPDDAFRAIPPLTLSDES